MSDAPRGNPKFPLRLDQLKGAPRTVVRPERPDIRAVVATAPQAVTPMTSAARAVLRPQAPVAHAMQAAQRQTAPSGLGLDSSIVRERMVRRLADGGLRHPLVLAALREVPRHQFVDAALVIQAYEDTSLPIGHAQTISKPSVVGRMIELLMEGRNARASQALGRTLEIGTGCGYQAAVLARLARQVMSVERLKPLHDKARELLAPLRLGNVRLVYADGVLGHAPNAPYDSIIAAAGGEAIPTAWLDQLAVGGRLVAPVRDATGKQALVVIDRTEQSYDRTTHETVQFVPLKSGTVR